MWAGVSNVTVAVLVSVPHTLGNEFIVLFDVLTCDFGMHNISLRISHLTEEMRLHLQRRAMAIV
jgi:hypothetical protein